MAKKKITEEEGAEQVKEISEPIPAPVVVKTEKEILEDVHKILSSRHIHSIGQLEATLAKM